VSGELERFTQSCIRLAGGYFFPEQTANDLSLDEDKALQFLISPFKSNASFCGKHLEASRVSPLLHRLSDKLDLGLNWYLERRAERTGPS
jgi:hypothetical protein